MNFYKNATMQKLKTNKKEYISDIIIKKIILEYSDNSIFISTLWELRDIVPIYLISGFIILKRYLKTMQKRVSDLLLCKIFLACCWISVKIFNDTHISCNEFLDLYKINYNEINLIEAHILSKINYDLDISHKEFVNWKN